MPVQTQQMNNYKEKENISNALVRLNMSKNQKFWVYGNAGLFTV